MKNQYSATIYEAFNDDPNDSIAVAEEAKAAWVCKMLGMKAVEQDDVGGWLVELNVAQEKELETSGLLSLAVETSDGTRYEVQIEMP